MKPVRLTIDDPFILELSKKLKCKSGNQICREALTLYKWIAKEVLAGRSIMSVDENGENPKEPVNDFLMKLKEI